MEKLEKRLGKLWNRVRRKKSKESKEQKKAQVPTLSHSSPSVPPSPKQTTTIVLRKKSSSTSRPRSLQGAEIASKLRRNGSKLSRQGSNRSSVKAQSEEPFISSDEEGQRFTIRKPIIRRRSSKKNPKVPSTNIAMFKLYYLANMYKLRDTILSPNQNNTVTLAITIPDDEFSSELGSDAFSKHSHISSLPKRSKRQPSREFDKESYAESSGYESGYMSNLELTVRDCHSESDHSIFSVALLSPINRKKIRMAPNVYNQRSLESFDIKQLSPVALPKSITLSKLSKAPRDPIDTFLRSNVFETKFITTVFEAAHTGIEDLLEDVQNELDIWFGKKMIGVACELHWSVPEEHRNRMLETKLKEAIHLSLRTNNRRLLYLRGPEGALPLRLAEGTTKENCFRNKKTDAFEGVYQRCYRNLLPYCHEETPTWHAPYWNMETQGRLNMEEVLRPRPSEFLFGNKPSKLHTTTLLALNIAALQIRTLRY